MTSACYHGKGVGFHSELPCSARTPRATDGSAAGSSPVPTAVAAATSQVAGPGPRQELSRSCRTQSTEPGALRRRGSWTACPAFGSEQSGHLTPGTPRVTVRGEGLVVRLPGPGGRLEDASQVLHRLRKPNPPLAVGSNKFGFPARSTAAEGLCAGPGIPATRRLSGHLWRTPLAGTGHRRCPGAGAGPGLGEEGCAER